MKSFQMIWAGGMAALLAASVGCQPPDRSAGGNGATSTGAGGFGGALPGTTSGPMPSGPVGSGPIPSGPVGSGPGPDGGSGQTTGGTTGGGPCSTDVNCDDGDLCTAETCMSGQCVYVSIVDDGDFCTTDSCIPEVGPVHYLDGNCCPHSVCAEGVPLHPACVFNGKQFVDCAKKVCNFIPNCCENAWDASCVEKAQVLCTVTAPTQISCACAHSYCAEGEALNPNCDPCVQAICSLSSSCCTTAWTAECVQATNSVCNIPHNANCQ